MSNTGLSNITRKHPLAKCEICPLAKARCAPTHGPKDAEFAIVSRSPGKTDAAAKMPFGNPRGSKRIIEHLLGLYDVERDDVLTTNLVLCVHDGPPPKEAIEACSERLDSDLANIATVIAAGAEATQVLTRRKSLSGARGYEHKRFFNGHTQRIIATNNPALVLKDDKAFPNLVKDFRLALKPLPPPKLPEVRWTNDINEGISFINSIGQSNEPIVTVDIETKGLRANADIVAIGFSGSGKRAVSIGEQPCSDSRFFEHLTNYFKDARQGNITARHLYHNGKFDIRNLRAHGISTATVDEDTMLLSFALDERSDEEQVHKLEYLLMNELNWPNYEPQVIRDWKSKVGRLEKEQRWAELKALSVPDELYPYNALDAAGTSQLFPILRDRAIKEDVFERPYKSLLLPASDALVQVELEGIYYDSDRALDMLEEEVWPNLDNMRAELQLIVGDGKYNPNSSQQNAKLVYDDWHILHGMDLKNERSVDKSVYTEIREGRFVVGAFADIAIGESEKGNSCSSSESGDGPTIIRGRSGKIKETAIRWAEIFSQFKELDKQRSTYLESLIKIAIANNGKISTNFKPLTVTGRLSSSGPNLQNITRNYKTHLPNIRSLFVAPDGFTLVQADYSQAELRWIAAASGDPKLGGVYKDKQDLHNIAAERFYGANFTKEQRSKAKNMNFGVAFRQTADTFQEKHDIPKEEGEAFIKWWWTEFRQVAEWEKGIEHDVMTDGYVRSPFGHKRRFHLITRENKNAAFREAINFHPQNGAAQLTIWSLIELVRDLPDQAKVILTVHDSILVLCRSDLVYDVGRQMRTVMESAPKRTLDWDFPFVSDIQYGQDWGHLEDLELSA